MISDEVLNKICPVPEEETVMDGIREELSEDGFAISSFKKGGIFYHLIRIFVTIYTDLLTLARDIIINSFVTHAAADWLDVKAADFGKVRKSAVKTQGYITIHRDVYDVALLITKGHMFKTKADVSGIERKYYAVADTVIGEGEESGKVLVEAEAPGSAYNVPDGKIVVSMIHLDGVASVSNEDGWLYTEGADEEETEAFRARVKESWSELSELTTAAKLRNAAMSVAGVINVEIDDQHPRGQGTTDIIVTGASGTATEELLRSVEKETAYLKGNYDDFLYKSAAVTKVDIRLTLYIAKDASTSGIKERAEEIISNMLQFKNRKEFNTLYLDDIRYNLKDAIESYRRSEFTSPMADVEKDKGSVVMAGEVEVTVKNIGSE